MKNKVKPILLIMAVMIMMLGLMNCSVSAAVKLNKTTVYLAKGRSATLKITGTNSKVTWQSNKPAIATVTSKGVVKAKAKGTAQITAKVGAKTYKCKVIVQIPKLSLKAVTLSVGDKKQLKVTGTNQKIKWRAELPEVAAVTQNGVVTARSMGFTTITATVLGKELTCSVEVNNVIKPASIKVTPASLTMEAGEEKTISSTFKVYITPSNAKDKSVSWTSGNSDVCAVQGNAIIAHKEGTAVLTAATKSGNRKASVKVTVKKAPVYIKSSVKSLTLNEKSKEKTITIYYNGGKKLTCKIADTNIVKYKWGDGGGKKDEAGLTITAVSSGTTTVTVSDDDGVSVSFPVTVNLPLTAWDYYQKMKDAMSSRGRVNSEGNVLFLIDFKGEDGSANLGGILYNKKTDVFDYVLVLDRESDTLSAEMKIDKQCIDRGVANVEFYYLEKTNNLYYKAVSSLPMRSFSGSNSTFSITARSTLLNQVSDATLSNLAEAYLKYAFILWNELAEINMNFGMKQLGFASYSNES